MKVCPHRDMYRYTSFFLPSNTPLHIPMCHRMDRSHFHELMDLSVPHFLAIMNNAINIHVQIFVYTYIFTALGHAYLRVGLLGHMVTSCFNLLRNCPTFPKCLHQLPFPQAEYEGSTFSASSPTLSIVCLFYSSRPSRYEVASHGFALPFSND